MKNLVGVILIALCYFLCISALTAQTPPKSMHHESRNDNSYRGRRMMPGMHNSRSGDVFSIEKIDAQTSRGFVVIQIFFTMPLDPHSVDVENILIDGQIPEPRAVCKFGRMGNMMQVLIPPGKTNAAIQQKKTFSVQITNITSYSQLALQENQYDDIRCETMQPFLEGH